MKLPRRSCSPLGVVTVACIGSSRPSSFRCRPNKRVRSNCAWYSCKNLSTFWV